MQLVKNAVENALKGLLSSQAVRDEPKIGSTGQPHSQPERKILWKKGRGKELAPGLKTTAGGEVSQGEVEGATFWV